MVLVVVLSFSGAAIILNTMFALKKIYRLRLYYTNKTEPLCFYCGSEDIDSSKDFCDCYPMCNQYIASKRPPVLKRKRAVSAGGPSGSGGPSSKRHKS